MKRKYFRNTCHSEEKDKFRDLYSGITLELHAVINVKETMLTYEYYTCIAVTPTYGRYCNSY